MGIFAKISAVYKQEGCLEILRKVLLKTGRCFFDTNNAYWFQRDLMLPIQDVVTKMPVEITFDKIDEMITWLSRQKGTWRYDKNELKVAQRCAHIFPHIKYKDEIIAYSKIAVKEVYIQDFRKVVKLPPGFAFCYDIYVAPEFRRYNIGAFLMTEMMKYFRDKGYKKTGCQVPPWNVASIGTMTKGGFKKYKYVRHVRILGCISLYFTQKLNGNGGVL